MKGVYVGLGNPGEKYKNNRHNVGFMMLDYMLGSENIKIQTQSENQKLQSILYIAILKDYKYLFAKPQAYMNKSGEAVKKIMDFYKISLKDLTIIYDDLDIRLGEFKIHEGPGPQLHNGILTIEEMLKTRSFNQIRIGVDNRDEDNRIDGETYVLQDFLEEERKTLHDGVFPKIMERIS